MSKEAIHDAFQVLAEEANIEKEMFEVFGDRLDNRFTFKLQGDFKTASARASQLLLSLRLGPGKFKTQEAKGAGAEKVKFNINPDKNGAQVRKEVQTKSLREIIEKHLPNKEVTANRSEGTILVDRQILAIVQVQSEDNSRIAWKPSKVTALALEQATI